MQTGNSIAPELVTATRADALRLRAHGPRGGGVGRERGGGEKRGGREEGGGGKEGKGGEGGGGEKRREREGREERGPVLQPQSEPKQHHAPPSGAKAASRAPSELLSRSTSLCVPL